MKISEIGGEFELIRRITGDKSLSDRVVQGIGDDCAVIRLSAEKYQLVTTDMMVENDHFNLAWHTPYQVGRKLMEANVSDIVCKGGTPTFAFLSMSLTRETQVEFVDDFYRGLYASAEVHGVSLLGGDTTHGTEYVFNLVLLGEVSPAEVRLRSGARVGDLICVTGQLGGSTAGLKLLLKGHSGNLQSHLEPCSRRVAEGRAIARYAHATIDVSDGLGSEVSHICRESGVGGQIDYAAIPLAETTRQAAALLDEDPCDFALYGGEDFEIVFTLPEESLPLLRREFKDFTVVGKILSHNEGVFILKEGQRSSVLRGYDHFA